MNRFFRIYVLPGAVLQSVMIGGGYGTGREIVEYFTQYGVWGGVAGLSVATVCIAIVFALSLEVSRRFQVYDYRRFFQVLLGRYWIAYEILAVVLFTLVIAVIGAAAGEILNGELGLANLYGVAIILVAVVVLNFYGRELVTKVLASWSVLLYAVLITYLVTVFVTMSDAFTLGLEHSDMRDGWFVSGMQYSFYNVTGIPIILYAAMAIETRREALSAGVIGALIAMVPALMLHLSFIAEYPSVLDADLPVYKIFSGLGFPLLKFAYLIVLFGTFIETGAGSIQGFIERLDGWWAERHEQPIKRLAHGCVAGVAVLLAGSLSAVGIVALIADGYGTLAWGFFIVYVVPLLTIGVYKTFISDNSRYSVKNLT